MVVDRATVEADAKRLKLKLPPRGKEPWVWELLGGSKQAAIRIGNRLSRWSQVSAEVICLKAGMAPDLAKRHARGRCEYPRLKREALVHKVAYTQGWGNSRSNHDSWWWGSIARLVRDLLCIWESDDAMPSGAASFDAPSMQEHY